MAITLTAAALAALLHGATVAAPPPAPGPLVAAQAEGIDFGDDGGEYPMDGECDDARFVGGGMAAALDTVNIGRDRTDCARLFEAGKICPVRTRAEASPGECASIDYGGDTSDWARDGECDDPRFTGPGTHEIGLPEDERADATDCRALCDAGEVWLK